MLHTNGFTREYASIYYYHAGGWADSFGMPENMIKQRFKFVQKSDTKFYYPIFVVAQSKKLTYPLQLPQKVVKKIKQKNCKILLFNTFEGWDYLYSHDVYISILREKYNLGFDDFVIVSGNLSPHKNVKSLYFNIWENSYSYLLDDPSVLINFKNNIVNSTIYDNSFICLNRRPRPHRIAVLTLLHEYRKQGILTMGIGDAGNNSFSYEKLMPEFRHSYKYLSNIYDTLNIRQHLPYMYDVDTSIETPVEDRNIDKFLNSYLHIVTETLISNNPNQIFFSEKTFKPIIFMRPFVLINRVNSLKELKKMGFETFGDIIDESYDDIYDNEQRVIAAIDAAIDFFTKPKIELNKILISILDRLEHNHLTLKKRKDKTLKSIPKKLINYLG
jgi:hypothetical protein